VKVIGNATIRQLARQFLVTLSSNYGAILCRLRNIA